MYFDVADIRFFVIEWKHAEGAFWQPNNEINAIGMSYVFTYLECKTFSLESHCNGISALSGEINIPPENCSILGINFQPYFKEVHFSTSMHLMFYIWLDSVLCFSSSILFFSWAREKSLARLELDDDHIECISKRQYINCSNIINIHSLIINSILRWKCDVICLPNRFHFQITVLIRCHYLVVCEWTATNGAVECFQVEYLKCLSIFGVSTRDEHREWMLYTPPHWMFST